MKTCPYCKETKPLTEFYGPWVSKNKFSSYCKLCVSVRKKDWKSKNPQKLAEQKRRAAEKWRETDRDLIWKYGITGSAYFDMLAAQANGCAICGRVYTGEGRRFPVDHDHETGAIRAILCPSCNTGLGFARDDPAILRKMADYLDCHK